MVNISTTFKNFPQYNELTEFLYNIENEERGFVSSVKKQIEKLSATEYCFEFVVENQRGMKFFGIPVFSNRSLIPLLDPPNYQLLDGRSMILIHDNIDNYPLPDLNWKWSWSTWYVLMLNDVDGHGWIYSHINFSSKKWKGHYNFGNFVRRRIWIRLRERSWTFQPSMVRSEYMLASDIINQAKCKKIGLNVNLI